METERPASPPILFKSREIQDEMQAEGSQRILQLERKNCSAEYDVDVDRMTVSTSNLNYLGKPLTRMKILANRFAPERLLEKAFQTLEKKFIGKRPKYVAKTAVLVQILLRRRILRNMRTNRLQLGFEL